MALATLGHMRSRVFSAAVLGLSALAAGAPLGAGCTSPPGLPLPPPIASVGAPGADGRGVVEGTAKALAYVHVLNQDTDRGKITRAGEQGAFRVELEAAMGDTLVIWQERDGDSGERVERQVPVPTP